MQRCYCQWSLLAADAQRAESDSLNIVRLKSGLLGIFNKVPWPQNTRVSQVHSPSHSCSKPISLPLFIPYFGPQCCQVTPAQIQSHPRSLSPFSSPTPAVITACFLSFLNSSLLFGFNSPDSNKAFAYNCLLSFPTALRISPSGTRALVYTRGTRKAFENTDLEILMQWVWGGPHRFAFLTSSQRRLLLLV